MTQKNVNPLQPYTGSEPFLFLCFSDADEARVQPLLRRLVSRGCRVWYASGRAKTLEEQRDRTERMASADLLILYRTAAFQEDTDKKSALLSCQARGCPIISIDMEDGGGELSLGLTKAQHIPRPKNTADIEETLLRTEGFSQALLGKPQKIQNRPLSGKIAVVLAVAAALLLAAGIVFSVLRSHRTPPEELPQDTIVFSDQALSDAVRAASGGGILSEETVSGITKLSLSSLPENPEELQKLPALQTLEFPQSVLLSEDERIDRLLESYEIILKGGGK